MNDLLEVAKLGKTIGLKGYLKLFNKSDFPSQFKKGAEFFLESGKILKILSFNRANSSVLFENFESINLANSLVNLTLFQTKNKTIKTCKLKKDEFFYFDIIGLKIFENDRILGIVDDILEAGMNFVFQIKTDDGLVKNGSSDTFFIPYIDFYVNKISLSEKKIFTNNAILLLENS